VRNGCVRNQRRRIRLAVDYDFTRWVDAIFEGLD
jgi:hypothetical protein